MDMFETKEIEQMCIGKINCTTQISNMDHA